MAATFPTAGVRCRSFEISDPDPLWAGQNLHDLYQQAHSPWEWHIPIMERARELCQIRFTLPIDETIVYFLEGLGAPAYKIASVKNKDVQLIGKAASTGITNLSELDVAARTARYAGSTQLVLLKCIIPI